MAENFANEYQTALSGGIDDAVTSLTVISATDAPAPNFRLRIDDEYLLVTGTAGTTFTVTRGIEGSAPAAHADGAVVTHVLTAGALRAGIGDYAAPPHGAFVQGNGGSLGTSSPNTIVLAAAPTEGNILYALTGCSGNVDVTPSSTGVTWTSVVANSNTAKAQIWKGVVAAGASATITFTRASGTAYFAAWVGEWSGIAGTTMSTFANGGAGLVQATNAMDVAQPCVFLVASVSTAGAGTWTSPFYLIGAVSNFIFFGYRKSNVAGFPIGGLVVTTASVTYSIVSAAVV